MPTIDQQISPEYMLNENTSQEAYLTHNQLEHLVLTKGLIEIGLVGESKGGFESREN